MQRYRPKRVTNPEKMDDMMIACADYLDEATP